jgi:hypothetical protein
VVARGTPTVSRGRKNVGLADALIAATATRRQVSLVTLNRKHFPMFDDVIEVYRAVVRLRPKRFAMLYTGALPQDAVIVL